MEKEITQEPVRQAWVTPQVFRLDGKETETSTHPSTCAWPNTEWTEHFTNTAYRYHGS